MTRTLKKFHEVKDLLQKYLGDRVIIETEHGNTFITINDSHFWMSNDFGEFIVGFGANHTHFGKEMNNVDDGVQQVYDLLTNTIVQTNYIKGNFVYKTKVEILFSDKKPKVLGKSYLLMYPFWKKTTVDKKVFPGLLCGDLLEADFKQLLSS